MQPPIWIDVFLIPVRDDRVAQVAVAAVLLLTLLDVLFGCARTASTWRQSRR